MPTVTSNPTLNTSPDPGQGGSAVTLPTNTGHANTSTNATNGSSLTRSCIWTAFQAVPGVALSINLRADWSITGLLDAAGTNEFRFQYSVDGGSNWLDGATRSNVVAPDSGSVNASLGAAQSVALVQMRVRYQSVADIGVGVDAQLTASISNIRLEVVTAESQPVLMWSLIFFLLSLIAAPATARQEDHPLAVQLEGWRASTVELLDRHFEKHPECELRAVLATIEKVPIFTVRRHDIIRAWVIPGRSFIVINANPAIKWDTKQAAIVLIHESLHLTNNSRGYKICGKDAKPSKYPICNVLGVNVYSSGQIDLVIDQHLF